MLTGAYADLAELLALRHRPVTKRRQRILRRGHQAGVRTAKLRGRGVDFSEVRLYQPGDDVRSIEWRVTARKNKPHTKVFREERERPVLVVVDQTQSMFFGSQVRLKSVAAAEIGATVAWQALAHSDRVGGVIIGNNQAAIHKPSRNTKAVARLLADLARQNQSLNRHTRLPDEAGYADSLAQLRRLVQTGFHILLISDFITAPDVWSGLVQSLARHNDLIMMHIADRLERVLPPDDRYTVTDGTAYSGFHSGDAKLRDAYADRFDEREQRLRALCAGWAVRYIPIMTTDRFDPNWVM